MSNFNHAEPSPALREFTRLISLTPRERAEELAAREEARRHEEERLRVASLDELSAEFAAARWQRICRKWASKHRR